MSSTFLDSYHLSLQEFQLYNFLPHGNTITIKFIYHTITKVKRKSLFVHLSHKQELINMDTIETGSTKRSESVFWDLH
jgi:hypothetical protein